ncbi:MAG: recombination protein O N-terminal domain-containing protein [Candidatus Colwellbacteria bacterium]|nr:recombination protein O N-terminal domain-containing protein [Candidatus Colwellbacteria bacterium]
MAERYTPILVLRRENKGNQDLLFTLYTKDLGKIKAIAKSARKITSKLAGHLTQGRIIKARIIDKGSFQLLDVLSGGGKCTNLEVIKFLHFLDSMTPYNQPDPHLWHIAKEVVGRCQVGPVVYRELLSIMGFVSPFPSVLPACAWCKRRERSPATLFYTPDLVFLCSNCGAGVKIDEDELFPIT